MGLIKPIYINLTKLLSFKTSFIAIFGIIKIGILIIYILPERVKNWLIINLLFAFYILYINKYIN